MTPLPEKHLDNAQAAAEALSKAFGSLKVLSSLGWPMSCRENFLSNGTLPDPQYASVKTKTPLALITEARKNIEGEHVVLEWLRRLADTAETTAHMLAARGTPEFYEHSRTLYGGPSKQLIDRQTRVIDLATHMDERLDGLDISKLVIEGYETFMDAAEFRKRLRPLLKKHFGDMAPKIEISDELSAKVTAGSKRIRIRKHASFSERDIDQLLQHEALVHTATGLNGRTQPVFPILGRGHAGATEIQEGLAVFAEMVSGAMDPARFRRLSDRVLAIQMSIEGADFKEVFDFYLERTRSPEEAFENTRRIFRGGVISGGAPFTKDVVYLRGLLRVHNYMRTVVGLGRADLIRLLFVGKLDIEDVPAMAQLMSSGRLDHPKYMPPWVKDMRFLVSYMAYSSFLNQVELPGFQAYYQDRLSDVPVIWEH